MDSRTSKAPRQRPHSIGEIDSESKVNFLGQTGLSLELTEKETIKCHLKNQVMVEIGKRQNRSDVA